MADPVYRIQHTDLDELEDLRQLRDDLLRWANKSGAFQWVVVDQAGIERYDLLTRAQGTKDRYG